MLWIRGLVLVAVGVAVAACGDRGESLAYVEAPPGLARPIQIAGTGRYDLWAVLEPSSVGSELATVAHSIDGGGTWRATSLPQFEPQGVQLAVERNKVWVAGTRVDGSVALASVLDDERGLTVVDVSSTFPAGASEIDLRFGGNDPDPMLTVRVPDVPQVRVAYVLDSSFRSIWYAPRGSLPDYSLVAVYDSTSAYFITRSDAGETLEFCRFLINTGPGTEVFCFDVSGWTSDLEGIYGSASGGAGDFLWHATPSGGDVMIRRGGAFGAGAVMDWPDDVAPLRFHSVGDGTVGIVGERAGTLVWIELDEHLGVRRERFLATCVGACDVNVKDVALLQDGALLVPTSRGWYVGAPNWHLE